MKIWIWNAFASNNSGSYTIVGSFPSEEEARRVAAELGEVLVAHSTWLQEHAANPDTPGSPLELFIRDNRLTWRAGLGIHDEWPQYGGKDAPDAVAVGSQVAVHHDYTVTMPRTFGELFYARGGRVDVELEHAHHPTVALFELWISWKERDSVDVAARVAALEQLLDADDGPFRTAVRKGVAPIVDHPPNEFGSADLSVAAVFEDLAAGFKAVDDAARATGFQLRLKVLEAFSNDDPLAFLRRSRPPNLHGY